MKNQYFREDEKILVVSGTHGASGTESQIGVSGLTDKKQLDHNLYLWDCQKIGVEPGPCKKDLEWQDRDTIFCLCLCLFILLIISSDSNPPSLQGYLALLCICVALTVPFYLKGKSRKYSSIFLMIIIFYFLMLARKSRSQQPEQSFHLLTASILTRS